MNIFETNDREICVAALAMLSVFMTSEIEPRLADSFLYQ